MADAMRLTLADTLMTQVATATSEDELHAALVDVTGQMGFDHFCLDL
jgi:hypothetical protein